MPWTDVSDARRRNMAAVKCKDTKPEIALRHLLHTMGYRYRLHRRDLPGTPDIVFPSRRKVIEVRGCFWHQHHSCRRARLPATREGYWLPKLARNIGRDRENEARLTAQGWRQLVVWECEMADLAAVLRRCAAFLDDNVLRNCVQMEPVRRPRHPHEDPGNGRH